MKRQKAFKKQPLFSKEALDGLMAAMPSKDIHSFEDLCQELKTALAERILKEEMSHHLGYEPHEKAPNSNRRNGFFEKNRAHGGSKPDAPDPAGSRGDL